jgi:hypothetical protein
MPFTTATARDAGRQGGRACFIRHGPEHLATIGRLGFSALACKLGFAGGSRRGALVKLHRRGRLRDLGQDPGPDVAWADRVLDRFDPNDPEVPL